jgi:FkbM family methyltransferase
MAKTSKASYREGASSIRERVAEFLARRVLEHRSLEELLVASCRNPVTRENLRVGALAMAYPRVATKMEPRLARLDGYSLYVNVREYLGVNPYFFGESGTAWPTRDLVRPGDVCVDAGANVGHYTFFLAHQVGATGRVLTFEPNPPYAEFIARSREENGYQEQVLLHQQALWDQSGVRMKFFVSQNPTLSGVSSLVDHGHFLASDSYIEVETIRLEDVARAEGIDRFAFVKIDVERAELQVLHGMSSLLRQRRVEALVVELLAREGAHEFLKDLGYVCFYVDERNRLLIEADAMPAGHFGDYLALSPDSYMRLKSRFEPRIRPGPAL